MYQGASVTLEDEQSRQLSQLATRRMSAWSELAFEHVTIKQFDKGINTCSIETAHGVVHKNIRVHTPISLILFLYGEPEELQDIPGTLFYRSRPEDGYVEIGSLENEEEKEGARSVNYPFYL